MTQATFLALAVLIVGACATAPTARVSGPPVSPSPVATVEPTNEPVAPAEWIQAPGAPSLADARIERVLPIEGGFVAVGCRVLDSGESAGSCRGPAVWLSPDAVGWGPAIDLPLGQNETGGTALAAAAGPTGLVIAGHAERGDEIDGAIWFSRDLVGFGRVGADPTDRRATVASVATLGGRFVAVGSGAFGEFAGFRAWWSADGTTWAAATAPEPDEAYPQAVVTGAEGGLLAWGPSCGVCVPHTRWWSSADGATWTSDGTAPGLEEAYVTAVGTTAAGLQAAGFTGGGDGPIEPGHWNRSGADESWIPANAPVLPQDSSITRLLPVGHGTVAAASGSRGNRLVAFVLGRGPDGAWRGLAELPDIALVDLLQHPAQLERILVVGQSGDGSGGTGPPVVWIGGVDWAP